MCDMNAVDQHLNALTVSTAAADGPVQLVAAVSQVASAPPAGRPIFFAVVSVSIVLAVLAVAFVRRRSSSACSVPPANTP